MQTGQDATPRGLSAQEAAPRSCSDCVSRFLKPLRPDDPHLRRVVHHACRPYGLPREAATSASADDHRSRGTGPQRFVGFSLVSTRWTQRTRKPTRAFPQVKGPNPGADDGIRTRDHPYLGNRMANASCVSAGLSSASELHVLGALVSSVSPDRWNAATADEDLRTLLEREAEPAAGALLFTCNGRGSRLFSVPDHDASLVSRKLGGLPLAGFNCAGEIGPIGGKNFRTGSPHR